MSDDAPASWHADPTGRHDHRYWDGTAWTEHVADLGVAATDPYEGSHGPPTEPPLAADAPADEQAPTEEPPAPEATAEEPTEEPPVPEATAEEPTAAADEPTVVTSAWNDPTTPIAVTPTEPVVDATTETPVDTTVEAAVDAPAAPAVPEPAPAPPSSGGGSSTNRVAIVVGIVAVLAIVLAVVVLVGGNSSGSSAKSKIASVLVSKNHFSSKDAKCVADKVVDEMGASRFDGIKDFDPANPPPNLAADLPNAVGNAIITCHVDASKIGNGPLTSGTSTTVPEGLGSPSDVSSFQELLANEYESVFGLARTKAECLAKAMTDAISSGKVTQGDATGSTFYRNFLDSCHVSLDDLNPSAH